MALDISNPAGFNAPMLIEDVRERAHRVPFTPFKIRTTDGEALEVPHRDFVMITKQRVVVARPDGRVSVLHPLHMVSLEEYGLFPDAGS